MLHKGIPVQVKDLDLKQGIICGYWSSFNVVDDGDDIIEPGAFLKSIAEQGPDSRQPRIKYLWQHEPKQLLGQPYLLKEDDFGLYFEAKIVPTTLGRDTLLLYEAGVIDEHSIGYDPVQAVYDRKTGLRHLKEIRLWEGSAVTWGMNKTTPTVAVKHGVKSADTNGSATPPIQAALADRMERIEHLLRAGSLQSDEVVATLERQVKAWGQLQARSDRTSTPTPERPYDIRATPARQEKDTDDMANRRSRAHADDMRQAVKALTATKAVDYQTTLTSLQESDELQGDWSDAFQAFVNSMSSLMWRARYASSDYAPFAAEGDQSFDAEAVAKTNLEAFTSTVLDLVKRSIAAQFAPMLDDDGDSFDDPDDDDSDSDTEYMSRGPIAGRKEGRTFSASTKKALSDALHQIKAGHGAISALLDAGEPSSADDDTPTNNGDGKDGKDGKSRSAQSGQATGQATKAGAGAKATTPSDDDIAQFHRVIAAMRDLKRPPMA